MPKHTQPTLPADAELVLPEQVTVALAGLAGAARGGLLALAVGTGLGMLGSLLEADVERLVGPRAATTRSGPRSSRHPARRGHPGRPPRAGRPATRAPRRWCRRAGPADLAGVRRHRAAGPAGGGADAGQLSTRRDQAGLEPVGSRVAQETTGTSKSAISRRFVAATERALAELLAADLSTLDLVALLVDGIGVAEHCCVVALGITRDGTKIPLGLAETLTVIRLACHPPPGAFRSTNSIESMLASCRDHAANVKRCQDGQMVLRWIAAGMGEAATAFRRVNGSLHRPALRAALDQTIPAVTPTKKDAAA